MNELKVSVIIPCYNVEDCLRRCVDSVLRQDISGNGYEIILVDDGSTDSTPAICDSYVSDNRPAVRVIHQSNSGVAAARNNGVAAANGELVAFLDSDDWWDRTYLNKMLELVSLCPDAGLYACKYWYVKYGRNEDRVRDLQYVKCGSPYINYFQSYYSGSSMPVWTGAVMMPKDVCIAMGGFPEGVRLGEDFLLWAKTAMHFPVAYLDECLSYYYNDVPPGRRLTKRLHEPQAHMAWHLDALDTECRTQSPEMYADWCCLRDKLRATGLRAYWLNDRHHDAAAKELAKVDWTNLPAIYKNWYDRPVWRHRMHDSLFRLLSRIKQLILSVLRKKKI